LSAAVSGQSLPYESLEFVSRDGLRLGCQSIGAGPPVVLANGLGGTFGAWRHLYNHLSARHRVVSWDYRGFFSSEMPPAPADVSMARHVDDLEDLLAFLRVERAVIIGWSMGTQLAFELYRRRPELIAGLGIVNGTAGRPFDTVRGALLMRHVIPLLSREVGRRGEAVGALAREATAWQGLIGTLKALGLVDPALDESVFADLAGDFGRIDFTHYAECMLRLGEHNAWDVLPSIRVPATIIVGERDFMTPVSVARRMSEIIPDARLVVVSGGSHYAPLEDPSTVNQAVDELLERCRWGSLPA
jgi:pimeloyl-ACP methyl ester carboxylesterase